MELCDTVFDRQCLTFYVRSNNYYADYQNRFLLWMEVGQTRFGADSSLKIVIATLVIFVHLNFYRSFRNVDS